ncbi:hypothetical protein SB717_37030, partial [Priestia sp. SIMBA_032]|uniref:hypothetical protein n=1 Tax=Priestia sp. SIMBA_032 TaxID=3085775 RepID=UPI00397B33F9
LHDGVSTGQRLRGPESRQAGREMFDPLFLPGHVPGDVAADVAGGAFDLIDPVVDDAIGLGQYRPAA